jgi:MFS transporter, DHA1 family, tetracycline resistance protein
VGFAVSQAFLIAPVIKRIGEWSTVLVGMTAAAIALTGTAFIHTQVGLYGFLMIGSLAGLAGPAINSLMSRQVSDDSQGELQGAINATNSLTAILGPLLATQLFRFFTTAPKDSAGYFPGAPFLGAGILVVIAGLVFVFAAWKFDLMHRRPVVKHPHHPDLATADPPAADPDEAGEAGTPRTH